MTNSLSVYLIGRPVGICRYCHGRGGLLQRYSALMLAARITFPHFSVSCAMNWLNSAGVIGIGKPPRSARRALVFGSARAPLTCLLSVWMISAGVFFGAAIPHHVFAS